MLCFGIRKDFVLLQYTWIIYVKLVWVWRLNRKCRFSWQDKTISKKNTIACLHSFFSLAICKRQANFSFLALPEKLTLFDFSGLTFTLNRGHSFLGKMIKYYALSRFTFFKIESKKNSETWSGRLRSFEKRLWSDIFTCLRAKACDRRKQITLMKRFA